MIRIKINDLLNAENALFSIKRKLENEGFDFDISYKVSRLINRVAIEINEIYAQKDRLIRKYGVKDKENENQYVIPPHNVNKVNELWNKFLEIEIEIPGIDKLSKEDLNKMGKFTAAQLLKLRPFIKEEVDFQFKDVKPATPSIDLDDEEEAVIIEETENG